MKKVLVIAPHADDETLGCGGTLLRHAHSGDELYWVILTAVKKEYGYDERFVASRAKEIESVGSSYPFKRIFQFQYAPAKLDTIAMQELVTQLGEVFSQVNPNQVYIPFSGDVHTDHQRAHEACCACIKWFRYPSVKKVLSYEVLSETEFGVNSSQARFNPNVFVDISDYIDKKVELCKIFESELAEFPFPRSERAIRSLADVRGAASGFNAAEAFMLIKETI